MQEKMFVCECCGKTHDGTYGSGRFCGKICARSFSTKSKRKEINSTVSNKFKGKRIGGDASKTPEAIEKWRKSIKITFDRKRQERESMPDNRPYVTSRGDVLDISREELKKYRQQVTVCEICGKPETIIPAGKINKVPNQLCADHNHDTGKFRGLLCNHCNSRLGWLETNKDIIANYLKRGL